MKDYNKLVEAIQKSVPEIMELKFGCKVKDRILGELTILKKDVSDYPGEGYTYNFMGEDETGLHFRKSPMGVCEILGRDITISEVIKAFKIFRTEKNKNFEFQMMADNYNLMKLFDIWDYSKPLHLQSDEVLEFLINLIVK